MTRALEALIREAFAGDLEELVIRVSRYEGPQGKPTPAAFQAIARHRGRLKGPWGVGIRADPVAAIEAALPGPENNDAGGAFG